MISLNFDHSVVAPVLKSLMTKAVAYTCGCACNFGTGMTRIKTVRTVIYVSQNRGSGNAQYMWECSHEDLAMSLGFHHLNLAVCQATADKTGRLTELRLDSVCEFISAEDWRELFLKPFNHYSTLGPVLAYQAAAEDQAQNAKDQNSISCFVDAPLKHWMVQG